MTKIKLSKIDGRTHIGIVCATADEAIKLFSAWRSLGIRGAGGQVLGTRTAWKLHGVNSFYYHKYNEVYLGNVQARRKVPMRFVNFADVILPHQERSIDIRYASSNKAINCKTYNEASRLIEHWLKTCKLYGDKRTLLAQWEKFGSGTCYYRAGAFLHAEDKDKLTQAGYEVLEFEDVDISKARR